MRQIADEHWGGCGEIVTLQDLAHYGLKTDEPGSRTARLREAALESVKNSSGPGSWADVARNGGDGHG